MMQLPELMSVIKVVPLCVRASLRYDNNSQMKVSLTSANDSPLSCAQASIYHLLPVCETPGKGLTSQRSPAQTNTR